jgi:hypothetical protein
VVIGASGDDTLNGSVWVFASHSSLTVTLAGRGTGSVSGSGINCPTTCSQTFRDGTEATLTATPDDGDVFAGWSGGGCSDTSAVCRLRVDSDTIVTAIFDRAPVAPATVVTLTATVARPLAPRCAARALSSKVLVAKPKRRSKASVGTLSLRVVCDQAATITLAGTVTASLGKKPKHGRQRTKTYKLKVVRNSLRALAIKTLVIKVPRGALSGLKRNARESAALNLTFTNKNGTGSGRVSIARLRPAR